MRGSFAHSFDAGASRGCTEGRDRLKGMRLKGLNGRLSPIHEAERKASQSERRACVQCVVGQAPLSLIRYGQESVDLKAVVGGV